MTHRALVLLVLALACARASRHETRVSACRPGDSATAEHLRYLRMLAAGPSEAAAGWRAGTRIPYVADTTNGVTVVTTHPTCARAMEAYVATARLKTAPDAQVEVIRADSVLVVSDPAVRTGEFVMRYVFDSRLRFLGAYLK